MQTLVALSRNLHADGCAASTIVSCETDGVTAEAKADVHEVCKWLNASLVFREKPASLPDHLNDAYALCESSVRLYVQDDWKLMRPLDIAPDILRIQESDIAGIRYLVPDSEAIKHVTRGYGDLDTSKQFVIPDWPMLSHRRWLEATGPYVGRPGHNRDHESNMAAKIHSSGLRVLVPDHLIGKHRWHYFRHIGFVSSYRT
jgi:hypothetical protein